VNSKEPATQRSTGRAGPLGSLFALALQHHQEGKLAEADRLYQEILARDPGHFDALHLSGVVAHQTGRNDLAVALIARAIAIDDRVSTFHGNIGEAYRALGRYDDAVAALRRAIALEPEFVGAHLNLGNAFKQQGKIGDAIAQYNRVLMLRPDFPDAHVNLGVALMDQGSIEDAVAHFERALALKPDFVSAHMNLGIALQQQGKLGGAVAKYQQALALKPDHALAHMNLGDALWEQGRLGEAIERYEQSLVLITGGLGAGTYNVGPTEAIHRLSTLRRPLLQVEDKCVIGLVRAECWRSPAANWGGICDAALAQNGMTAASRYELMVRKAIGQWMARDLDGLAATLEQCAAVDKHIEFFNANVKNSRAYAGYLGNLLSCARAQPELRADNDALPLLPVIGDSHSLAYDGTTVALQGVPHRVRARLVMGCKAFHLAADGPNRYRWLFAEIARDLPEGAAAICSFGEIDCRLDEGILPHYRKAGGDLEALVRGQVEAFVASAAGYAAPRRLALTFLNVPAPNFPALRLRQNDLVADDEALLTRIIRAFNSALEQEAVRHGHRTVDLYAISAVSPGARHLDDYHLRREVLGEALG
jgi:tetratricopeptide (TPR) repeat protein